VSLAAVRSALAHAGRTPDSEVAGLVEELPGIPVLDTPSSNAVLLALFEEDGEARVVLERRSNALRRHRGEVSFPGGRIEPGESPVDAALREAHEEVGIDPTGVEVVGWLRPLRTYSGASVIHPYVGVLSARPSLAVEPAEVAYAFDVAIGELLDEGVFREEQWRRDADGVAGYVTIYVFEAGGETIWGATARILAELCALVASAPSP
jgi:8-oxo-dGTP pyrophosphatase MutT (NUDIX family)